MGDRRKCQTNTASPAEPGGLPVMLAREHVAITVKEFAEDGVVYQAGDLRVIAFAVDHGDAIKPAYGYRIEYRGRVAVISGGTRYNTNVLRFGGGADLLVQA